MQQPKGSIIKEDKKPIKILIAGSSGMLGKDIVDIFSSSLDHFVFCASKDVSPNQTGDDVFIGDLTDSHFLNSVLKKVQPDVIINCAAIVDVDICEKNHDLADALHVETTKNLAKYKDARNIYISSDSVFSGQRGNYTETDETDPQNYYAKSKLLGEKAALAANSNTVILRTNIYGFHLPLGKSLAEWAIQNLLSGDQIEGFVDVFFNPLYTKQLARVVKFFSESSHTGIIHVAANQPISKYEFLRQIGRRLDFPTDLILKGQIGDSELWAKRPKNSTLNADKLSGIYKKEDDLSLSLGLREFCSDWKQTRKKNEIKN